MGCVSQNMEDMQITEEKVNNKQADPQISWLAAHGFVPSGGAEGVTCWSRTCGGVHGVPEDGIEARLEVWRSSAGVWFANANVLLSGSRSKQCGMTSAGVSGCSALHDEGPDVALSKCIGSMALLEYSDKPNGFAEIARIVVGRYKKVMADVGGEPESGSCSPGREEQDRATGE